jgi:hypothetical protein
MGLISFFNSSFFEDAHIVVCSWPTLRERLWRHVGLTEHTRRYIIAEEWLLNSMRSSDQTEDNIEGLCNQYEIPRSFNYTEAGGIYRRIKTSLDNIKAYEEAAWLYFNEIEMRRLAWVEESRRQRWRHFWRKFPPFAWNIVYSFYKITAGYGERPINSVIAFLCFLFAFASIHLFNGIQLGSNSINYDIRFNINAFGVLIQPQFWSDWLDALKYAVLRSVPIGYIPVKSDFVAPIGSSLWDLILSLTNTVVLMLLLVFTGVGLKRHFKRF